MIRIDGDRKSEKSLRSAQRHDDIYIYIERERERVREKETVKQS